MNPRMKKTVTAIVATLVLSACGDDSPKTIKEIDHSILSVEESKDGSKTTLRIVWKLAGMSSETDMSSAAMGMERIVKGLVKHFPNQQSDEVRFVLNAGLVDRYGNQSQADVFEVPFAMAEIRKINFASGSFSHWDLLNLSEQPRTLHPVGAEFIAAYCKEESNIKYAKAFCLRAVLSRETAPTAPNTSAKQSTLSAAETKLLASDTLAYFSQYQKMLADDAAMNQDALSRVFNGQELKAISRRWPAPFTGDLEAEKYTACQNLLGSASSYAHAQHDFAFKGLPEKDVLPLRTQFKQDLKDCKKSLDA